MQRRSSYLFALVRSGFASMATEIFAKCEMPTNVRGTSLEDVEMKPRMLALSHKRREGKLYSRVPFGWREGNDKALVPVPAEQKALAAAKKMREAAQGRWQVVSGFCPSGDALQNDHGRRLGTNYFLQFRSARRTHNHGRQATQS
jgi:hypothetical protein